MSIYVVSRFLFVMCKCVFRCGATRRSHASAWVYAYVCICRDIYSLYIRCIPFPLRHPTACLYRVAKTHRIPHLYESFSAKVTYI